MASVYIIKKYVVLQYPVVNHFVKCTYSEIHTYEYDMSSNLKKSSVELYHALYCLLFAVKRSCCFTSLPSFPKELSWLPAFTDFRSIHVMFVVAK